MKRKENGFAATGILYTILLIFLVLMSTLLVTLSSRTRILDKLKSDAKSESTEVKNVVYANGTAVYYNPETGKKCEDYTEANSTTGTKSGCMKWYAFNDDDKSSTVNVILDHNTTSTVVYNSTGYNNEMEAVADVLKTDTRKWKSDLNPRLIEANEIAKITGHPTFDASKGNQEAFFFDSNNQTHTASSTNKSNYAWLFDYTDNCTVYGCNKADSRTYGYWTSTRKVDNSTYAWLVVWDGSLGNSNVTNGNFGVRPVITIPKSVIKDGTGSEEKIELYEDGTKVGVTKNGKKCKIGTTDCYTGYTYGDTKGATKLNLVIGYDANVTGSKNMKASDLYTIVGLDTTNCRCFTSPNAEFCNSSDYIFDNVISEDYQWLYDFDYCENKNYLFRINDEWGYGHGNGGTTLTWVLDKKQNKMVSETLTDTVDSSITYGDAYSCKIPKVVTVDKANFYYK